MSRKKRPFEDAANDIDAGLNGLLGALGEAIGEMVSKLDDGKAGSVNRNMTFDTDKGPIKAQAGVRLRMGGMDIGTASKDPQPVNPNRHQDAPQSRSKDLSFDLFEDADDWILTADVPGVEENDINLAQDGDTLLITTKGARIYEGEAKLDTSFHVKTISTSLRNGILTLTIPKGSAS